MRITLEKGINASQLVYDTGCNSLHSFIHTLQFTNWHTFTHPKTLVLTDLDEESTNLSTTALYTQVATLLHSHAIDRLIGIGPRLADHAGEFSGIEKLFYPDIPSLLASGILETLDKNIFIIKNNPKSTIQTLIPKLQHQCHETILEIDINAIQHNLSYLRSNLSKDTGIIAMIKASAYGSSNFEVAHFLQQWQVSYLSVAYTDEGVTLRQNDIHLPIMVMNPSPKCLDKLVNHHLEPVIYSLHILKALVKFITPQNTSINVHIKLDTGMYRLGFLEDEVAEMVCIIKQNPLLRVQSVFSHLAAQDSQHHDTYTHTQARLFQRLTTYIEQELQIKVLKHLLNTAGSFNHPIYEFDLVRLGIGLYGFRKKIQQHLQLVSTLKTIISQIKEVPAGATIGYERKGIVNRPSKIAILAIGYADGFRYGLSNGIGKVWVNGHLAPVVGNVCMDMVMIDITGITAQEGDEVIIFGKEHPATDIALKAGTIVYEILTNTGERIKRVYYKEFGSFS